MNFTPLAIDGAWQIDAPVHLDDRGYFREWAKEPDFVAAGVAMEIRQANMSRSCRNTVRGLHYSLAPQGQIKIVTCVEGTLDEVLVDVRVGSPTFGRVATVSLAADLGLSVFVPSGVAHGICVTSEWASLVYLLSSPYDPSRELEIDVWDEQIGVKWNLSGTALLSAKDAAAPSLLERQKADELPLFGF